MIIDLTFRPTTINTYNSKKAVIIFTENRENLSNSEIYIYISCRYTNNNFVSRLHILSFEWGRLAPTTISTLNNGDKDSRGSL